MQVATYNFVSVYVYGTHCLGKMYAPLKFYELIAYNSRDILKLCGGNFIPFRLWLFLASKIFASSKSRYFQSLSVWENYQSVQTIEVVLEL